MCSTYLNCNDYAAWNVSDSHSAVCGIYMLTSRACGSVGVYTDVIIPHIHVNLQKKGAAYIPPLGISMVINQVCRQKQVKNVCLRAIRQLSLQPFGGKHIVQESYANLFALSECCLHVLKQGLSSPEVRGAFQQRGGSPHQPGA